MAYLDPEQGKAREGKDLIARPSDADAVPLTVEGHPDGSTEALMKVTDPLQGDRLVITRFSANCNVTLAAPRLDSNGMRLYLGVTDPDPAAPDGISIWIDGDGVVHHRASGAWVP